MFESPPRDHQDEAERQAGLLGCYGALAGMVGGIGLGFWADRVRARRGQRKALLVSAIALSAVCFTGFALACSPELLPAAWANESHALLVVMERARVANTRVLSPS